MEQASTLPEDWYRQLASLVGPAFIELSQRARQWAMWDAAGPYRLDGLAQHGIEPLAVVRPGSAEEVASVLRWAARHGIAIVARGAGTGVMGGAIPLRRALVVEVDRLRDVIVEPENQLAVAGAGATLAEVNAALRPYGWMLGHDPWSLAIATVGGAISTDGVGYMAGRWGSMSAQVAAIEFVLADGTIVRTRRYKPAAGPDLRALVAGSQGTFAIITRAWLYVVPIPEVQYFRSFRFRGFAAGYQAILDLWATGLRFDLLDFSDGPPERFDLEPGYEDDDGRTALLHLGAFGPAEEARARLDVARRVLTTRGAHDLGPEPAARFWAHRHDLAERYARLVHNRRDPEARQRFASSGLDYLNLALPPARVLAYRRAALARIEREKTFVAGETGIWCRPELFSLIVLETQRDPHPGEGDATATSGRQARAMRALMEDLLRLALEHDGTIEYIHGPGLKLLPLLKDEFGSGLDVIRRLKSALDPYELLNPGKWQANSTG
ncbi:MAG TPA: FAD-binding oxidoreductase [Bacillota bacterium]